MKPDGECDFIETDKNTAFENNVECLLYPEKLQSQGSPSSEARTEASCFEQNRASVRSTLEKVMSH